MKYLIIGTGSVGSRHVRNIATLDRDAEFIILRSSSAKNEYVDALQAEYIVETTQSLSDAIEKKPFAAIIANPTTLHVKTALSVLPHCRNIFIEKPLAAIKEGVAELKEKAGKATIMVGYCLRFHPVVKRLKDILDAKRIGRIYSARAVSGSYLPDWRKGRDYSTTGSAKKEEGGGVILEISHEIDYLYWFFGKPSLVKAVSGKVSNLEIETEDCAEILLRQNDVLTTVHLDYFNKTPTRTFEAVGEKGTIHADLIAKKIELTIDGKKGFIDLSKEDVAQMYIDEMRHFLACCKEGKKPLIPLKEGIDVLDICLAAKISNI